jgi:mRNA interferase RelE/StbE
MIPSRAETTMEILWTSAAEKELRKIPANHRVRIVSKVKQFAANPSTQANNVKPLKGRPESRLRVGDYRVLFSLKDGIVTVLVVHNVRHRSEAYD